MKENNALRRRLEAMITVFELAEKHEVVVSRAAGALLDTVGQLMLHEVQTAKGWENNKMSIELIMMEREIAKASGQPDSPIDLVMDLIMGAMGKGAQVEVVSGDSLQGIMAEIAKRAIKSDADATPEEGTVRPAPDAPSSLNPAAAWPFGTKD